MCQVITFIHRGGCGNKEGKTHLYTCPRVCNVASIVSIISFPCCVFDFDPLFGDALCDQ